MEKKMKRIAFDMERAKSITEGREPGRVVTEAGMPVRLVCFDRKSTGDWVMVGLVDKGDYEDTYTYDRNGDLSSYTESYRLWLEVPEETELKPFDRVLVRDGKDEKWKPQIFGRVYEKPNGTGLMYVVVGGAAWKCCIPYEGNEHLLGTNKEA